MEHIENPYRNEMKSLFLKMEEIENIVRKLQQEYKDEDESLTEILKKLETSIDTVSPSPEEAKEKGTNKEWGEIYQLLGKLYNRTEK